MVIVLDRGITADEKRHLKEFLNRHGLKVKEVVGEGETILGAVGQVKLDHREVEVLPGVVRVIPISKPYKLASRELQAEDTVVTVGPVKIGGKRLAVIAGPCSVESREQIMETARMVRESGAVILRGGAFKPRTSPYAFQGLGEEGLRYLKEAGEATGMPVVTEIMSPSLVDLMRDYVDMFQIGARNMQNFDLLKTVGSTGMPVLLKRGLAATIEEWLMAAEYLLSSGTENVILCERGIRTFETYTRNSLDISSIPVVKNLSHLPVIVDPSHATGIRSKVRPVGLAAIAAGADGLMVEVHPDPEQALSDGPQSLYPQEFERLMRDVEALSPVVEKEMFRLPTTGEMSPVFSTTGRSTEGECTVAFQGERGAYSEMALIRYFQAETLTPAPETSFQRVFDAVLEGKVDYGIVPLENSLSGSIHENFDLLLRYPDIRITGETIIRIIHSLISTPSGSLESIRRVFSHPQGLAQCSRFLDDHPEWEKVPYYDTAGSVAYVAELGSPENAAIANSEAARVYGMKVLKEGIETNPQNYTRFAILAREGAAPITAPTKASILFSTPDTPGALSVCMEVFSRRSLNLKKLESRPIWGKPWSYMFYLDIDIKGKEPSLAGALEELHDVAEDVRVLGVYRAG
jgi:3-deoxy-7-phosphoheptulonate synthase